LIRACPKIRNGNLITFTTVTKDFCFRSFELEKKDELEIKVIDFPFLT